MMRAFWSLLALLILILAPISALASHWDPGSIAPGHETLTKPVSTDWIWGADMPPQTSQTGAEPDTADAEDSEEGKDLRAPKRPLAEQPARTLRIEPPKHQLWENAIAVTRHDEGLRLRLVSTSRPRAATLRPWAATPALHLELCIFLR